MDDNSGFLRKANFARFLAGIIYGGAEGVATSNAHFSNPKFYKWSNNPKAMDLVVFWRGKISLASRWENLIPCGVLTLRGPGRNNPHEIHSTSFVTTESVTINIDTKKTQDPLHSFRRISRRSLWVLWPPADIRRTSWFIPTGRRTLQLPCSTYQADTHRSSQRFYCGCLGRVECL